MHHVAVNGGANGRGFCRVGRIVLIGQIGSCRVDIEPADETNCSGLERTFYDGVLLAVRPS